MTHVNNRKQQIFKKASTTFYNASKRFPANIREDVQTLYAFVRIMDEFVDEKPQRALEFEEAVTQLEQARQGVFVEEEIIKDFVDLERRKNFDPEWTNAFVASMRMDLTKKRYETYDEVLEYCYGSASVIGLFMCAIFETTTALYAPAKDLGTAFQLINMVRDIQEDLDDLFRSYIAQEDIKLCGLNELSKQEANKNPRAFEECIRLYISRYKQLQLSGFAGLNQLPKQLQIPVATAAQMYDWTADQIAKNPQMVWEKKIKPSKLRVLIAGVLQSIRIR